MEHQRDTPSVILMYLPLPNDSGGGFDGGGSEVRTLTLEILEGPIESTVELWFS